MVILFNLNEQKCILLSLENMEVEVYGPARNGLLDRLQTDLTFAVLSLLMNC